MGGGSNSPPRVLPESFPFTSHSYLLLSEGPTLLDCIVVVVAELLSRVQFFETPGFPVLHCLPESAQTHVH